MVRTVCILFLGLCISSPSIGQIVSVQPKLVKSYLLPKSYEEGGISVSEPPATSGEPRWVFPVWGYSDGQYHFMERWTFRVAVFDKNFVPIKTVLGKSPREVSIADNQHILDDYVAVTDNMEVLLSQQGVFKRYASDGRFLTMYDLTQDILKAAGTEDRGFLEKYRFTISSNGNDGIFVESSPEKGQYLGNVLLPDGRILRTDEELQNYIRGDLYKHRWTVKNVELAAEFEKILVTHLGFAGSGVVTENVDDFISELLVRYFAKKKIFVNEKDYLHSFRATDRGFWARSKGSEPKVVYFDLIQNKIFLIAGLTPATNYRTFWNEAAKKAFLIYPGSQGEESGKTVIQEYSLDFFQD